MDRFSKFHPFCEFIFFVATFVFTLSVNNPFFSAVSLVCAFAYAFRIKGREMLSTLKFSLLIIVFVSIFNMLFAHYGEDVLFRIKNTEFTAQALFYGFNQGMVLSAVIVWFIAFGAVVDSEKIIYLFRFAPKCALIFSMILGFIPRFSKKIIDIREAQIALKGGVTETGIKEKYKQAMSNFSALITYSLESSIITADSMNARGYNPKAVRHGRYKLCVSDIVLIAVICALSVYVIFKKITGCLVFVFEPLIYSESFSISAFVCFTILELLPFLTDLLEDTVWKLSNVKM